jgi:Cupin superfamily protein
MNTGAERHAAEVTGTLWAAIHQAGGPRRPASAGHQHWPGAFDQAWLAGLPLPIDQDRPAGAVVALLDATGSFDRHTDERELAAAYADRARTRVYEDTRMDDPDSWYALVARHLGRLAGCHLAVTCSIFQSVSGDTSLGSHYDAWFGAIVQVDGAKRWELGDPATAVTTRPGDVLLLPKGLLHAVSTPPDPGRSLHMLFTIHREVPSS